MLTMPLKDLWNSSKKYSEEGEGKCGLSKEKRIKAGRPQ
jgi:hypothetical protein